MRFFDDLTGPAKDLYAKIGNCPNCGNPTSELVFKEKNKTEPRIICKKCGLVISVRNRTNNIKEILLMALLGPLYAFAIGFALGLLS